MSQLYDLTKSMVENYYIQIKGDGRMRCMWANITLSENGVFNAQTDCGDFSYRWSAFGDCFKSFLIRTSDEYLYNKLMGTSRKENVDLLATVNNIKSDIIRLRKEEEISEFDARYAWDDTKEILKEYHNGFSLNDELFYGLIQQSVGISDIYEDIYDEIQVNFKPNAEVKAFCEVVMPVLRIILQKELDNKLDNKTNNA